MVSNNMIIPCKRSNSSIWPIDGTLTVTIIIDQSRPGSNDNEGVLHISQNFRTGVSPSDGLVLYSGHLWEGSYSSAKVQLAYSTGPAKQRLRKKERKKERRNVMIRKKKYYDKEINHHHHHHHVVPPARISLTISRHFSLSFIASGRSSELHPVSSHSCCM